MWLIFRCENTFRFVAAIGQLQFCDMECDLNLATIFRAWFRLIDPQLLGIDDSLVERKSHLYTDFEHYIYFCQC